MTLLATTSIYGLIAEFFADREIVHSWLTSMLRTTLWLMLNNDSVVSDCLKVSLLAAYKFDVTLSPALVTSYVIYEQVFLKVFIWFDSV